jgi:hypothetical protein
MRALMECEAGDFDPHFRRTCAEGIGPAGSHTISGQAGAATMLRHHCTTLSASAGIRS